MGLKMQIRPVNKKENEMVFNIEIEKNHERTRDRIIFKKSLGSVNSIVNIGNEHHWRISITIFFLLFNYKETI